MVHCGHQYQQSALHILCHNLGGKTWRVCVEGVVLWVVWKTEIVGSTSFLSIVRSAHSPSVQHLCTRHIWTSSVAPPRVRHPSGENT